MARGVTPSLVVLVGLPGAGKSTLAAALCTRLALTRVDRDAIRAARFRSRRVTGAQKRIANEIVWRRTRAALREGRNVLIDGMTFARVAERRRAQVLARRCGARCVEIFIACPIALAQRRVARGAHHPSGDRSAKLVLDVARRFEPVSRSALRLDARALSSAVALRASALLAPAPRLSSRDAR